MAFCWGACFCEVAGAWKTAQSAAPKAIEAAGCNAVRLLLRRVQHLAKSITGNKKTLDASCGGNWS